MNRTFSTGLALFLIFAATAIQSCSAARTLPPASVSPQSLSLDAERDSWDEAMRAFESGNYDKAAAIFEFLVDSARTERMSHKATYALACARLALAQTPAELNEAMALWSCWLKQPSDKSESEDPRMLTPLLDQISAPDQTRPKAATPKPSKSSFSDQVAIRDLAMYKNQLQAKEKELEKVKAKLESREKEVRRLKHQMDSIEAIHLKYQEKKKEISTP